MDFKILLEWLLTHRGKVLGVVIGFAFGMSAIIFGIVKTFFVTLCIVAGYFLGKNLDEKIDLREKLFKFFKER